jgi:hypothetical protein
MKKTKNVEEREAAQTNQINDMPPPATLDYDVILKLSDKFVNDSVAALSDYAYVEVSDILNTILNLRDKMPINVLNEIIRRIGSFPYKSVAHVMRIIESDQPQYWSVIEQTNNK